MSFDDRHGIGIGLPSSSANFEEKSSNLQEQQWDKQL